MATSTIPNPNLSFDTTPTSGSSKPVTSNGIYNAIQQSTANNTWTTTTIAEYAYGNLVATKNAFLKLVIMRWAGNGTKPTEASVSVNLPAGLVPASGQIAPLKSGDNIEARRDGTVRITFTSTLSAWSGGQVVYHTAT